MAGAQSTSGSGRLIISVTTHSQSGCGTAVETPGRIEGPGIVHVTNRTTSPVRRSGRGPPRHRPRRPHEVLDPERLEQKALEVMKSVELELADRAVAAYEDLVGGR